MSEVRECDECGTVDWASSPGAPSLRTVETIEDGEVVDVEDRILCGPCYAEVSDV